MGFDLIYNPASFEYPGMFLFSQTAIYAWTKIVGLTMDDILIEESQKRVQQPILAGKPEFQI